MAFPRRIGNNARTVRATVFGPNPVSVLTQGIIDAVALRNLADPTNGVRAGEPSSRAFRGDVGIMQRWPGVTASGSALVRPGFNQALPNTAPPPGVANVVLAAMANNGTLAS